MACGIPVVAVRQASVLEVCGEAALLVETDPAALVQGIRGALDRRADLAAAGLERASRFTWERTARGTEEVYREALG